MGYKEILVTMTASAIISILMTGLTLTITKKCNYNENQGNNSIQTTSYTIKIEDCTAVNRNRNKVY